MRRKNGRDSGAEQRNENGRAAASENGRPAAGTDFPIAIIGAGFAGIGMAIRLKQAGILSFTIFERGSEIGGTWRDNTYPGAACDVPSHVYSYSFEPNPDWSRAFAGSEEIQRYLLGCVDRHRLRAHLRLNTEIRGAVFDEKSGVWTLTTGDGETVRARAVISGVGGLVDPSFPDIKGLDSFRGELMHTARWNHDYDLDGKRVAVIGTGASAIQVIPAIAPRVGRLTVFQRTPAWVMPKQDRVFSEVRRRRYRNSPWRLRLRRTLLYLLSEFFGPMLILDSPRLSRIGERRSERHLRESVTDPVLREKLRPDFQLGCKRVLVSDDYWPSLERPNVELVTDPIVEIGEHSVRTRDGREHEVDAIVAATGFDVQITAAPFPVVGLRGVSLDDAWKEGAEAYKGVSVAGIPNWFIMMGPNTGPGHTSVLIYTEAQIDYALQAIRRMIARDIKYLTVRRAVQDRYNARLRRRMKHTVWHSGCSSWYLGEDGVNHALYPGLAIEYTRSVRRFRPDEYEVVPVEREDSVPVASGAGAPPRPDTAAAGRSGNGSGVSPAGQDRGLSPPNA